MKKTLLLVIVLTRMPFLFAEDGYRLWLRYDKIDNVSLLQQYRNAISGIQFEGSSPTLTIARQELSNGLSGLLDKRISGFTSLTDKSIVAGTLSSSTLIQALISPADAGKPGKEGFIINTTKSNNKKIIVIAGN